ncbi:hypothetical protein TSUD_07960 [Trifolium subterraneum]|nr:hypothetical protein TSUD_07960 [Trifolium subterraneum]
MLCKLVPLSRKKKSGSVPVYLNVYDLTPINGYAYWFGLGVYHSGVQVHGVEYGFGAHDRETTGIFEVEPGKCPGFTFRKSIYIGSTDMGPKEVREFMEKLAEMYPGNTYHLIQKNCNHFCSDVCVRLTGKSIPRWVNRLARIGSRDLPRVFSFNLIGNVIGGELIVACGFRLQWSLGMWLAIGVFISYVVILLLFISRFLCNCVLPTSLNETKVGQGTLDRNQEGENKKMRSQSRRHEASSSPSLSASQRHCLPPSSCVINTSSSSTIAVK